MVNKNKQENMSHNFTQGIQTLPFARAVTAGAMTTRMTRKTPGQKKKKKKKKNLYLTRQSHVYPDVFGVSISLIKKKKKKSRGATRLRYE